MPLTEFLLRCLAFIWGTIVLITLHVNAIRTFGWHSRQDSQQAKRIREAQRKIWALDNSGELGDLRHAFVTLSSGLQLHYVTSPAPKAVKHLLICLHGFPDSWHLWTDQLRSSKLRNNGALVVALDLPGCGGSDSLSQYGPDEVLNAIVEAIVLLKKRSFPNSAVRCTLVGHDWGGAITARLVAETEGLFERGIYLNAPYMPLVKQNLKTYTNQSIELLKDWAHDPMDFKEIRQAWEVSRPVRKQMLASGYIFLFILPWPMLRFRSSEPMRLLLDYVHRFSRNRKEKATADIIAENQAASYGPSAEDCATYNEERETYSRSVLERSTTDIPGDWWQRIRLYREGLATRKWTVSPDLQKYGAADLEDKHFKCPVTVLFGLKDRALQPEINLDNVEQFFKQSSSTTNHVVRIPDCAHWVPLEVPVGSLAVESTLLWATGSRESLDATLGSHQTLKEAVTVSVYSGGDEMVQRGEKPARG